MMGSCGIEGFLGDLLGEVGTNAGFTLKGNGRDLGEEESEGLIGEEGLIGVNEGLVIG